MLQSHSPLMDSKSRGASPAEAEASFLSQLFGHIKVSLIATIVLAVIVSGLYPAVVWALAQTLFHNKANGSMVGRDGQPVAHDQDAVGSALIGQSFSDAKYFHPRPSAAGNGYDATASGGSNLGPTSAKLIYGTVKPTTMPATQPGGTPLPGPDAVDNDGVRDRIVHYCLDNNIAYQSTPPLKQFLDASGNPDDVKLIKAFNSDNPPTFVPAVPIPADAVTASGSGLDPHISPANAAIQKTRVAQARGIRPEQVQALIDQHTDGPDLGILGDPGVNVLMLNLALDSKYPVAAPLSTQPSTQPTVAR